MLANQSPMSMAERGLGRMTYAKKKPFAEHDLRVTLQRAGKKRKHHHSLVSGEEATSNVSSPTHSLDDFPIACYPWYFAKSPTPLPQEKIDSTHEFLEVEPRFWLLKASLNYFYTAGNFESSLKFSNRIFQKVECPEYCVCKFSNTLLELSYSLSKSLYIPGLRKKHHE